MQAKKSTLINFHYIYSVLLYCILYTWANYDFGIVIDNVTECIMTEWQSCWRFSHMASKGECVVYIRYHKTYPDKWHVVLFCNLFSIYYLIIWEYSYARLCLHCTLKGKIMENDANFPIAIISRRFHQPPKFALFQAQGGLWPHRNCCYHPFMKA